MYQSIARFDLLIGEDIVARGEAVKAASQESDVADENKPEKQKRKKKRTHEDKLG
jgi:hypothetical protein